MISDLINKHSERFENYSFEDKKDIIHMIENSLRSGNFDIESQKVDQFKYSRLILKRITYYLSREYQEAFDPKDDIICMIQEYEKINSSQEKRSLTPLHYCIRLIKRGLKVKNEVIIDKDEVLSVYNFLLSRSDLDINKQIKNNLKNILEQDHERYQETSTEDRKTAAIQKAKSYVIKGQTFEAIRTMLNNTELNIWNEKTVTLLSNRLNRARKSFFDGTISNLEYSIEQNKITDQVLDQLKD